MCLVCSKVGAPVPRNPPAEITAALSATSVLWDRYRTFAETAADEMVTANPMYSCLHQPRVEVSTSRRVGRSHIDCAHVPAVAAPVLDADTEDVLTEHLALSIEDLRGLREAGVLSRPESLEATRVEAEAERTGHDHTRP